MMDGHRVPGYVSALVRRMPPGGAPVVLNSTPVIAFGDPARAQVATLGINPSVKEFMEGEHLLSGANRRLATLDSLGADRLDRLTDAQVDAVVKDCAVYFHRRPYRLWFDVLDNLLRAGLGASYYDGSACHLDLVQWATDPVWGKIPDPVIRQMLLDDGVPHLRTQLERENIRVILLNGRQVVNQVLTIGLANLYEVGSLPLGRTTCRLYTGAGGDIRWVGWSTNLQSGWGVSTVFKETLAAWVCSLAIRTPKE